MSTIAHPYDENLGTYEAGHRSPDVGSDDKDLHTEGKSTRPGSYLPDLNNIEPTPVEAEKSIGVAKIEALCR